MRKSDDEEKVIFRSRHPRRTGRRGYDDGTHVEEGALLLRLDDRRAALGFEGARDETIKTAMDFIASAGLTGGEREGWDAYILALTAAGGNRIPNIPPMNARQNLLAVTKGLPEAHRKLETAAISRQDHFITAPFAGILFRRRHHRRHPGFRRAEAGRSFGESPPRGSLIRGRIPLYDSGRLLLLPAAVLARDALDSIVSVDLPPGAELVETIIQNPAAGMALAKEQDS